MTAFESRRALLWHSVLSTCLSLLVSGASLPLTEAADQPPQTLLYVPFDGSADATVAADGYGKGSYTIIRYHPGRKGQAAEIGSRFLPSGLMAPCALNLDKGQGTIELWFCPQWDNTDPKQQRFHRVVVADEKDWNAPGHTLLNFGSGSVGFHLRTTEDLGVGASVGNWKAGEWHHVVVTWDCTFGLRLFLDGAQAGERKAAWTVSDVLPSRRLHLGCEANGTNLCDGWLDDFRIYDRALAPEEVRLAFEGKLNAPPAPVRRNEGRGTGDVGRPHREPQLTFYCNFDGTPKATKAAGNPDPRESKGLEFAPGLEGRALSAKEGIVLAYDAARHLSKEAGAVSLWVAPMGDGLRNNVAYFADEFNTWLNPNQVANALWLWLWSPGAGSSAARFDMRPPLLQANVSQWTPGSWHHLAGCWQNGEELSLYIDGERTAVSRGRDASWKSETPSVFYLGGYKGQFPARALLDEVKLYDGPLSLQEVREETVRHILPLHLDLGRTLFERGQGGDLPLRLYNSSNKFASPKMNVRILPPSAAVGVAASPVVETSGTVNVPSHGWGELRVKISGGALAFEGVYQVRCVPEGHVGSERSSYFLVVPPIPTEGPSDGVLKPGAVTQSHLPLRLVDEVDCTKDLGPERFASTGNSKVTTSPLGAYREAGPQREDRMAFRFKVQRSGIWHVAVVTYPDDKERSCDIIMNGPKYSENLYDVATGYFCGDECRTTGKRVDLPIYFTPREQDNALVFMTLEPNRPAAVATIKVYEVEGGLPSAVMNVPSDGGRRIGNYWEDPTICLEHGGLDFSAPEVFKSFSRLADYLRFSGQNLICYPIAWYIGTMYPSSREGFRMGAGSDRHTVDWIEYALRLCERRSLRFLPEMYFAGTIKLQDQHAEETEDAIWAGKPTIKQMMWDGTLSKGFYFNPPYYNPLHPVVRQALIDYVDEALDRYARYPALEGISLIVGQGNCVWFGSIQSGYDDYTVRLFEKETGIKVGSKPRSSGGLASHGTIVPDYEPKGPARFSWRFRWLVANKYEEWVRWRCEKLRDLYAEIASRIQRRRPDLRLYLTFYSVDGHNWNPMFKLDTWRPGGRSASQIYHEGGFDMALYKNLPGVVLRRVMYPIDYRFFKSYYNGGGPNSHEILSRDIELLSEGIGPFKNSSLPATAFHCRYFESDVGRRKPTPGFWWNEHPWRVSQPTASGRNFLEFYAHAVAELDSVSLAYGGYTVLAMGHEEELCEFARNFRALPTVRFRDVPGMSDPVCMREWTGGGRHYFYLVNRMPCEVAVDVVFRGQNVAIGDLANGEPLRLDFVKNRAVSTVLPKGFVSEHDLLATPGPMPVEGRNPGPVEGFWLSLSLKPYELRSFALTPPNATILCAGSGIPVPERQAVTQRIEEARKLVAQSDASTVEGKEARETMSLIERAWRKGEYSRAGYLLDSFPLARLRRVT